MHVYTKLYENLPWSPQFGMSIYLPLKFSLKVTLCSIVYTLYSLGTEILVSKLNRGSLFCVAGVPVCPGPVSEGVSALYRELPVGVSVCSHLCREDSGGRVRHCSLTQGHSAGHLHHTHQGGSGLIVCAEGLTIA